jgi:hypothetical protein
MKVSDGVKSYLHNILAEDRLFIVVLFITVSLTAFGLGRLAERAVHQTDEAIVKSSPTNVIFTNTTAENKEAASSEAASEEEQYVASKSGTKYHYPWCPGAKQMKEENKIYFDSRPAAEAAGYTPAANCKGL